MNLLKRIRQLRARQRQLRFSPAEYSVLLVLEEKFGPDDNWIDDVRALFEKIRPFMLDGWVFQGALSKKVERELRSFVRRLKRERGLSLDEMNKLYDQLLEQIRFYGIAETTEVSVYDA